MEKFSNASQLTQWTREKIAEDVTRRRDMEAYAALNRSYYIGVQWINQGSAPGGYNRYWKSEINNVVQGDQRIKATVNEITGNIIRIAAATNPDRLDIDALPLHGVTGVRGAADADLIENLGNMLLEMSGSVSAARTANFERSVDGRHGIGYRITADQTIRWFEYDGYRVTTDLNTRSDRLAEHEYVIYSQVWSLEGAKRVYGEALFNGADEKQMRTVGELTPTEQSFYHLTNGRMYAQYARNSKSKGLVVHEVYLRGNARRFDRRYLVVSMGSGVNSDFVLNFDNPENPYGGNGMPLGLLNGFPRPGSEQKISDSGLMIDKQNKLNMTATLFFQQMYNYVHGHIWFINKAYMGKNRVDESEIIDEFNKGYVFGNTRDQRTAPPQLVHMPPPNPALEQTMAGQKQDIKESAFQSAAHQGQVKSHVPDASFQLAADLSQLPLDDRVKDDVNTYQELITNMIATGIGLIRSGSPEIVLSLQEQGFTTEMIGKLAMMDSNRMPISIRLRDQALRPRSRQQRVAQIERAVELGGLDPSRLPILFAELDVPIDMVVKETIQYSNRVATNMLDGQPFQPILLGNRAQIMIDALQRAAMSETARSNPQIGEAVQEAIITQMEIDGLLEPEEEQAQQGGLPPEADLQSLIDGVSGRVG